MSALYKNAFEEVICTDLCVTFELLFLKHFAISLFGMVLVMLWAAMYPFRVVFSFSSLNKEDDVLEEYRAYLQYLSSFINWWGRNMDTSETSSESTSYSSQSAHTSMNLEVAKPSAPPESPSFYITWDANVNLELGNSSTTFSLSGPVPQSFQKAQVLDCTSMCENQEKFPLSPPESRFTFDGSPMYAPNSIDTSRGDSDEYTPLTPHTSNVHSSKKQQFTTPDSTLVVSVIRQQA
jgi:hypothetical protein